MTLVWMSRLPSTRMFSFHGKFPLMLSWSLNSLLWRRLVNGNLP